jgi:L-asparaginase/Glu-tRNA(Gln) amidotransferase subunit D
MGSGDLNPQKARIIVMLGLAAGMRPMEIVSLLEAR